MDSRKRSRSPVNTGAATLQAAASPSSETATSKEARWIEHLQLSQSSTTNKRHTQNKSKDNSHLRTTALNELLQASSRTDVQFTLTGDDALLRAILDVGYESLGWTFISHHESNGARPVFSSAQTWNRAPTPHLQAFHSHCCSAKDWKQHRELNVVVMILRNWSFVAANVRMMAYTDACIALLVGCLYSSNQSQSSVDHHQDAANRHADATNNLCLHALQTLLNLQPHLDVSGQKTLVDQLFYNASSDGPVLPRVGRLTEGNWGLGGAYLSKRLDVKEDLMDVSTDFLLCHVADQLVAIWSIFTALHRLLVSSKTSRPVLLLALDWLQEAISSARVGVVGNVADDADDVIPSLRAILVHMPDSLLERLVSCLSMPRLGPGALDYADPRTTVVTRVTTLKLLSVSSHDIDARDRALDVLVPLVELDTRMAGRLPPSCGDVLLPLLTTTVGRTEAPTLAWQLLQEFAQAHTMSVWQERLVELASRHERISQLVWNLDFYPAKESDDGDEEEGDDQEGTIQANQ